LIRADWNPLSHANKGPSDILPFRHPACVFAPAFSIRIVCASPPTRISLTARNFLCARNADSGSLRE
ncbi:MAG: hypothetical protein ABSE27_12160, partial [Acidobacteriaceae bacterium]